MQWGHLVRTGVVKRDFRQISLNNIITLGTRIRIVILKVCLGAYELKSGYSHLVLTNFVNLWFYTGDCRRLP